MVLPFALYVFVCKIHIVNCQRWHFQACQRRYPFSTYNLLTFASYIIQFGIYVLFPIWHRYGPDPPIRNCFLIRCSLIAMLITALFWNLIHCYIHIICKSNRIKGRSPFAVWELISAENLQLANSSILTNSWELLLLSPFYFLCENGIDACILFYVVFAVDINWLYILS